MSEPYMSILTSPAIRVVLADGDVQTRTLPELLAELAVDGVAGFPALRPHQEQAWHCFLVQLAALALEGGGLPAPPTDPVAWTQLLLELTGGRSEPWCLVVEDLAAPALLQPPVPEGTVAGFRHQLVHADELDVLVTSRNFDVKAARYARPAPDDWLFALVTLQTTEGFSGQRNYGIARMNGGFASRPFIGYAPGPGWGERFRHDVGVAQRARATALAGTFGYPSAGGLGLLWLEPWDGRAQLDFASLDPLFIEVCRRVRILRKGDDLVAHVVGTTAGRVDAATRKGNTGDPWTPLHRSEGAALTIGASGYRYELLQEILFGGDWHRPEALRALPAGGQDAVLIASGLARGKGRTAGLHRRFVPLPAAARARLGVAEERERLGELSRERVERVATMSRRVLHPALCMLLQAGAAKTDLRDRRTGQWLERFDREVDRVFFPRLWEDFDRSGPERARSWASLLRSLAEEQLEDAIRSVPMPSTRYHRAVAMAQRVFWGASRRHFPELLETVEATV